VPVVGRQLPRPSAPRAGIIDSCNAQQPL